MRVRIFLSAVILLSISCAGPRAQICSHIRLQDGRISLNNNERILVCGTSKDNLEGWRQVPLPQAQFALTSILQNRGYLHPRFERSGDELAVWQGSPTEVQALEVVGGQPLLNAAKKRKVLGEVLTPEVLDEVKSWAQLRLQSQGYACPVVQMRAQAWDGRVVAMVKPGAKVRVAGIDYAGLGGLDAQSLARHQAMQPGDVYDVRESQLTASRLLNDALFQTAYFTETCHGDTVDLHLNLSVGKPRIFRFGLGASTEEFPFTSIWFRDARLDDRASSFTASLYASPRKQNIDSGAELYRWPWSKRTYLGPRFFLEHEKENAFELNRARLGADLGRLWDMWKTRMRAKIGPTLNYENTVRGVGPHEIAYISWDGMFSAMSRDYELFARDLYQGWSAGLDYRGQRKGVGSPINVDRFGVSFRNYLDLGHYSPPLFVLGWRLQGTAVNYSDLTSAPGHEHELLPLDYRIFYGGDENLRGFSRLSLNNGGSGYLTALYSGFELRLIEQIGYRLEPFLLLDLAQLGDRRFTLDHPVFLSQGAGLRWPSPFGTLRGSIAKGRILHEDASTRGYAQQWVGFLSYGQEF